MCLRMGYGEISGRNTTPDMDPVHFLCHKKMGSKKQDIVVVRMDNATKLELCNRIAAKYHKNPAEMKQLFESFIDEIFEIMSEGRRIEIRGFGCFQPKKRKERLGRNPRTGDTVKVPAYTAPTFKFSKEGQKVFDNKGKKRKPKNKKPTNNTEKETPKTEIKENHKRQEEPKAGDISKAAETFSPR